MQKDNIGTHKRPQETEASCWSSSQSLMALQSATKQPSLGPQGRRGPTSLPSQHLLKGGEALQLPAALAPASFDDSASRSARGQPRSPASSKEPSCSGQSSTFQPLPI